MDEALAVVHAGILGTKPPGVFRKAVHHDPVGPKKIVHAVGVKLFHEVVSALGVFDLSNLVGRPKHPFAVDDGGHLIERKAVLLDGKRRVDGLNAQFAMECWA